MIQGATAVALSNILKKVEKAPGIEDKLNKFKLSLNNPSHINEMRELEATQVLLEAMTDSNDPISGYPPEKVLEAFRDIASISPSIIHKPSVLKPVLRRYLAGSFEPFEAKELIEMERRLTEMRTNENRFADGKTPIVHE